MGNPAGGILVMLLALYLLLAYFSGRLEWLFRLRESVGVAEPSGASPGDVPAWTPRRPATVWTPVR